MIDTNLSPVPTVSKALLDDAIIVEWGKYCPKWLLSRESALVLVNSILDEVHK